MKKKRIFKNILVVRTDRIGDVVLTTPSLQALRESFPQAKISVLVTPQTKPLVEGNPNIDEVLVDDREGVNKGFLGFWRLVFQMMSKRYDLAVIYHTKNRMNLLCWHAMIPYRIGFNKENKKFSFLLTHPVKDIRHLGEKREIEYCLDLVRSLNDQWNSQGKFFIPVKREDSVWAEEALSGYFEGDGKTLAVHLGASDKSKMWPVDKFIVLIRELQRKYKLRVVLVGGENLSSLGEKLVSSVENRVLNLIGRTTVGQMVAVLKCCDVLVSNDSGPVHVADAVGTPVVSIFTRNQPGINPERWGPVGKNSQIIAIPQDLDPDFKKSGAATSEYLQIIETKEVFAVVDALLKLC